jgi:hypothetical protein
MNAGRWLAEIGLIPEDDSTRMARFRKMAYKEWPNPDFRQAGIGQAPENQLPWSGVTGKSIF